MGNLKVGLFGIASAVVTAVVAQATSVCPGSSAASPRTTDWVARLTTQGGARRSIRLTSPASATGLAPAQRLVLDYEEIRGSTKTSYPNDSYDTLVVMA